MNNFVDIPVPPAQPGTSPSFEPLVWVKQHCASYITNDAVQKHGDYYYRFYFGREKDLTAFILRWL